MLFAVSVKSPARSILLLVVNEPSAVIAKSPARSILLLLVNAPFVVIAKLLKLLNALKESLIWVKSSVRIKFKLVAETVPLFAISSQSLSLQLSQ